MRVIICNNCNKKLPLGSKFCQYCGSKNIDEVEAVKSIVEEIEPTISRKKTIKKCKDCGEELPLDSNFCQYCGSENIQIIGDITNIEEGFISKKENNYSFTKKYVRINSYGNVLSCDENEIKQEKIEKDTETTTNTNKQKIADEEKKTNIIDLITYLGFALSVVFILANSIIGSSIALVLSLIGSINKKPLSYVGVILSIVGLIPYIIVMIG